MSIRIPSPALSSAAKLSSLLWIAFTCGCMDANIHFDAGTQGKISVQENTRASAWHATARVGDSSVGISYKLAGTDGQLFSIDQVTGDVFFKTAPDFEQPLDADKNNEYRIEVEASHNGQVAVQTAFITVEDVFNPQIELVTPKIYQNVGDGIEKQVRTRVQFVDVESGAVLKGDSVVVDKTAFVKDANNPDLWNGVLTVPAGGVEFEASGRLEGGLDLHSKIKLLNKANAISPSYLALNPSTYIFTYDASRGLVGKLNLQNYILETYLESSGLKNILNVSDFNSGQQFFYSLVERELYAVNLGRSVPQGYAAGCFTEVGFKPLSLIYDLRQQRIVLLTQQLVNGTNQLRVLSMATDNTTGLANASLITDLSSNTCTAPIYAPIWDLPVATLPGTFKQFALHRDSRTLIFADERIINNQPVTVVQGFSETGEKRFEAQVGPDISNLAVNQSEGIIYLAERHSSARGTLKTINVSTGAVGDLTVRYTTNEIGAYSDLRMDNPNKLLYIADAVSDSLFKIDLQAKILNSIEYTKIVSGLQSE